MIYDKICFVWKIQANNELFNNYNISKWYIQESEKTIMWYKIYIKIASSIS